MLTKKQWKIQSIAEYLNVMAANAALEAAHRNVLRQPMVREHGVIADEIQTLASKTLKAVENNIFGSLDDRGFDKMMLDVITTSTLLALNAALLASKEREHKPLAIFADMVRNFSIELSELYGNAPRYSDIPKVSPRSAVIADNLCLFSASSGKFNWVENTQFVQEVFSYAPDFLQGNRFVLKNSWRNMDMPFIKISEASKDSGIVIISDPFDSKKNYAVLADFCIHALTQSYVGVNKPCKIDLPVRECWSASDGRELIFIDWEKLTSKVN